MIFKGQNFALHAWNSLANVRLSNQIMGEFFLENQDFSQFFVDVPLNVISKVWYVNEVSSIEKQYWESTFHGSFKQF